MTLVQQLPLELKIELQKFISVPAWKVVHTELLDMTESLKDQIGFRDDERVRIYFYFHHQQDCVYITPRWMLGYHSRVVRNIHKAKDVCRNVEWGCGSVSNMLDAIEATILPK